MRLSTHQFYLSVNHQIPNISRILVGHKVVDHADVIGASRFGAAPNASSFSTPGTNELVKDNC